HLVRAVALLAERVGEEVLQPRAIEVQEILLGCCGFVHWTSGSKKPVTTDRHGWHGSKNRTAGRIAFPLIPSFALSVIIRANPWQRINARKRPLTGRSTRSRRQPFPVRRNRAPHWRRSNRRSRRGSFRRRLPSGWSHPSARGSSRSRCRLRAPGSSPGR